MLLLYWSNSLEYKGFSSPCAIMLLFSCLDLALETSNLHKLKSLSEGRIIPIQTHKSVWQAFRISACSVATVLKNKVLGKQLARKKQQAKRELYRSVFILPFFQGAQSGLHGSPLPHFICTTTKRERVGWEWLAKLTQWTSGLSSELEPDARSPILGWQTIHLVAQHQRICSACRLQV